MKDYIREALTARAKGWGKTAGEIARGGARPDFSDDEIGDATLARHYAMMAASSWFDLNETDRRTSW